MGHKKKLMNTVAMKTLKSKFSRLIASAKFQSAMGAFHRPNLVGNYHAVYSNVFVLSIL